MFSNLSCNSTSIYLKIIMMLLAIAWIMVEFIAFLNFMTAPNTCSYYSRESHLEKLKELTELLAAQLILSVIPFLLQFYVVCYMQSFFSLVKKNFDRVPRNRAISNMVYVPNLSNINMFIEITGEIAAALRRKEIGYDQIND